MANANFFSPDGGITRYPLEDTEGRIMYADDIDGINRANPNSSRTISNGITYVKTSEMIMANGTASGSNSFCYWSENLPWADKPMILKGCPSGGSSNTYQLICSSSDDGATVYSVDIGEGVVVPANTTGSSLTLSIYVRVKAGASVSNLEFNPMLYDADYGIDFPFRSFNQQSIQHQLDSVCENGAVNHLDNKTTDMTISGITFTVDDNKIIYANGTSANSGATPQIAMPVSLPKGRWVCSGCPDGGSDSKWDMIIWDETTSSRLVAGALFNSNDRLEFEITDANVNHSINVYARVHKGGVVCNNIAFKPMIASVSYTGPYVPYAMTNRELTEKAGVWTTPVSCLVGDTDVTITNPAIHTTSTINPYIQASSGAIVAYSNLAVTEGQAVITFGTALTEAASVKLQILNI